MRLRLPTSLLLLCLGVVQASGALHGESYAESLRLTPFPDGKVHSDFRFTLEGPWADEAPWLAQNAVGKHSLRFPRASLRCGSGLSVRPAAHHHTLLPRQLTSLIRQFRVTSFHLALSAGRWAPTWPLHLPAALPASGIELTAWLELLEGESELDERRRWEAFVGAVGGLFCAGIGGEGVGRETSSPGWAVEFEGEGDPAGACVTRGVECAADEGQWMPGCIAEHRLYRLVLPRLAAACTESLTPFLSLLPCASHAGLSSLLNPHRLFDGEWTLLDVKVARFEESIKAQLGVGSVADPVRRDRLSGQLGRREFSMSSLYDRTLSKACPVAASSRVELVVPSDSVNPFSIEPSVAREMRKDGERDLAVWETATALDTSTLDVRMTWPGENPFRYPRHSNLPLPPLATRRLLTGYGQERGRIGIEVANNLEREAEVVWVETWPWWVRGFVSSLEAKTSSPTSTTPRRSLALARQPSKSSSASRLARPANSLSPTSPPLCVPGAIVVLLSPSPANSSPFSPLTHRQPLLKLHTPTTLISLPLPDFSMPYNVIILTSTLIALFFGSVMNGLVRRWYCVDLRPDPPKEKMT
ncbi:SPOSA6832_03428, partial [Sporobolomyces salmonicolor]